mgnify:CR=1 FL=1
MAESMQNLSMCRSDHTDGRQRSNTYGMGSESKR